MTAASARLPRHRRPSPWSRFFPFGVAYYPEQWSDAERAADVPRLRDAGVNTVRMGEFAWDVFEPSEGHFDFALFDETIARLGEVGIRTILGTPTAAPPRWLTHAHPEILRETAAGQPIDHGGRQHGSLLHPVFRAAAERITRALAAHYADNPHIVAWQTDNELNVIGQADFSAHAGREFQRWLKNRYGRIERLNEAWGMRFSAGTYGSFDQIPLPLRNRPDGYPPHPGHLLDYRRFHSDATCDFHATQVEILRRANPRWRIFHNGLFAHLDYWKLTRPLDCLGVDLYPDFGGAGLAAVAWSAFKLELCRAHSGSFVVPELASGPGGAHAMRLETPEPGQMRLWAWQCIAHGADGIIHFRWRTCRAAVELHWHGVLGHDDVPRRRLAELTAEAHEIARLAPALRDTVADVRLAVLIDNDADEQHDASTALEPRPRAQAEHLLGALLALHLPAGLVHAHDRFDGLEVIFLPSFGHVSSTLAGKLERFVRRGGCLICTAGTGTRDLANRALATTPPGPLVDVLGATVEETGYFRSPLLHIETDDGTVVPAPLGYEILQPAPDTEIFAAWQFISPPATDRQPHPAIGRAAITARHHGRGHAFLVGAWVTATTAEPLVRWLARTCKWTSLATASAGVTIRRRVSARHALWFVLNHTLVPQRASGLPRGTDLISGRRVGPELTLPPLGVVVIRLRT